MLQTLLTPPPPWCSTALEARVTIPRTITLPSGLRLHMDLTYDHNALQAVDLHFIYLPPSLRRTGIWSQFVKGPVQQFLIDNPTIDFKVSCIINSRVQSALEALGCFYPLATELAQDQVLSLVRPRTT